MESDHETEVLFFPIRNEQGFKVNTMENYWHLISVIANAQTELAEDYPEQAVIVYYECYED